jgi:hypothetical protein
MLFVLLAVVGGLLAGYLFGGSLRRLEATRLHRVWLLLLAVAAQLVGAFLAGGSAYAALLVATLVLAVGFLLSNPGLAGRGLIGAGLALNALVIVANSAMPVELPAAAAAGVATGPLADDPRHTLGGPGTRLSLLDDRIPLPLPLEPQVLSAGDVLVAAGAGLMVAQAMRRRATTHPPVRPATPSRPAHPPRGVAQVPGATPQRSPSEGD